MRSLIHLLVFRTRPTAPRHKTENWSYVRKEQFASMLAIKRVNKILLGTVPGLASKHVVLYL